MADQAVMVPLEIPEPGDVNRTAFPLTVGVPFAPGVLKRDMPVAIEDANGGGLPIQTRVMEKHSDGSVRWLLVDFQCDMKRMQTSRVRLVLNRESKVAPPRLTVKEQGDRVLIDTGVLSLEADRKRCVPLRRVSLNGAVMSEGDLSFTLVSNDGAKYDAANDASTQFQIEESGPLRAVLLWRGTHRDPAGRGHFDYEVRLTVYAGQAFVRVDHIVINRLDPAITNIKKLTARVPIRVQGEKKSAVTYSCGGPSYHTHAPHQPFAKPVRVEQYKINDYQIRQPSEPVIEGNNNCQGWVGVSGAEHSVLLAAKSFWQNFPKALEADENAITYELVPDRGSATGGFDFPRGMAKTHTFYLHFQPGAAELLQLHDTAFALQCWPLPSADSTYYASTGEFWEFFPYLPERYQRLEYALENLVPNTYPICSGGHPPHTFGRAYGLKHYGDQTLHPREFCHTAVDWESPDRHYLNNSYDPPFIMGLYFLRSHNTFHWWEAESQALHMIDVDTCHHAVPTPGQPDSEHMLGAAYAGAYQHIGELSKPNSTTYLPASGMQHYSQGLMLYYHLTGDPRGLETAIGYADFLAYMAQRHRWGVARNAGWTLTTLGTVYRAAPKEEYRKGAAALLDTIERDVNQMVNEDPPAIGENPATRVTMDRGINLCQRGLIVWHQATGDKRTANLILRLADVFIRTGVGRHGVTMMGNWPEFAKPFTPNQGFAGLDALAYAYRLSGDRRYVDAGLGSLCLAVEWVHRFVDAGTGNHFVRPMRGMFPFFTVAHEMNLLDKVPGAGLWLA